MTAEELIDVYLGEGLKKGPYLTGKQVARLKSKQHVFIDGKRAVVVDINMVRGNVEVIYVKGRRAFGKEKYLTVPHTGMKSVIQSAEVAEGATKGMKNAYEKLTGAKRCPDCGMKVPKYPGRYPNSCPECGTELEDLQNSPRYSETAPGYYDRERLQQKDRRAANAQMRRIPQDRVSRGPYAPYET